VTEPFRIEPTFSPRIWGSLSLAPIFPDKKNLQEPIGEAWLTDVRCRIASGRFEGRSLGEVWRLLPADWRGERCAAMTDFPLLVKFIFPADKLSIQVHPDDAYASEHERPAGGRGKTEMWHVVAAKPDAKLLLGLRAGTTKEKFAAALKSDSLEELFQTHNVQAGQTFFIPPGTPHTIGPGMILCEVQQYSDLTYRVHDYGRVDAQGRPRKLHVRKALDVIRFGDVCVENVPPLESGTVEGCTRLLAACRYFATQRLEMSSRVEMRSSLGSFHLIVVLSGRGEIRWNGTKAAYGLGECWFVPASLNVYEIVPSGQSVFLQSLVPDLGELRATLRATGAAESQITRVLFE